MSENNPDKKTGLERGTEIIRAFVDTLPNAPGVYRMLNAAGDVLYVGKARALKKRVVSYTRTDGLPLRLQRMVAETAEMVFVGTHTEVEALLLEANLIKTLKPRYNILLKDGKSFPYILITGDHDYPQLVKHRGARKRKGRYFGPFASGFSVNETIATLQRVFMLRTCSDSVFAQRTRPCLQYHIKRCTAPCVNKVTREDYARQVEQAHDFLSGKSRDLQDSLVRQMQDASDRMEYEKAASLRDRIQALAKIRSHQDINVSEIGDADIIAVVQREGKSCVQVFFFRGGQNFGNRAFFPHHAWEETPQDVLGAFLAQFYADIPVPPLVLISHDVADTDWLEQAFEARSESGRKVRIARPERGARRRLMDFAERNAAAALDRHLLERASDAALIEGVAKLFDLGEAVKRIEVYDNSHIGGTDMVGAMIVAGPEGFMKNAYRKFNIRIADAADDYGMMREVMQRRFAKGLESESWPDLLLIDGGLGQLNAVREALAELGIADDLTVVSIAKGPERNAGRERFFVPGKAEFQLPEHDPVLHYLQRLRDEAHRFAIGSHRARRAKRIAASPLDSVPGIGAKRKKALLLYFGSAQDVARAGVADLEKVGGISRAAAERIYSFFHEEGGHK